LLREVTNPLDTKNLSILNLILFDNYIKFDIIFKTKKGANMGFSGFMALVLCVVATGAMLYIAIDAAKKAK
jgi:hypothetical protein